MFWRDKAQIDLQGGHVIFHELMHMTSSVGDETGYCKKQCLKAAHYEPKVARNNANNYMLFAEEAGYSHQKYMEASRIYGVYHKTWNFKDKWVECARNIANGNGCCKKSNIAFGRLNYPKNCAYTCEAFDK